MAEEERLQTLSDLERSRLDTVALLEKLPIQIKTQKVQKFKLELETKLQRLEKAIVTFSKPKVYVQL
jgi:DNA polymerase I-like protein with 3'-5' exonuclease and polymerase domains